MEKKKKPDLHDLDLCDKRICVTKEGISEIIPILGGRQMGGMVVPQIGQVEREALAVFERA